MLNDIVGFLVFFLLPGLVLLVFGRKMVEYNARSYPRVYGRIGKPLTLLICYLVGLFWISLGFTTGILPILQTVFK